MLVEVVGRAVQVTVILKGCQGDGRVKKEVLSSICFREIEARVAEVQRREGKPLMSYGLLHHY